MMPTRQRAASAATTLERVRLNGVWIAYQTTGDEAATPLVMVHGSFGSHHNWGRVVGSLAERFRVVTYDRRGHSDSERLPGQGSFREDVSDLAALIEHLGLAPAWVAGNSAGAVITLQLAAARPELLRGIVVHEPPVFSFLPEGGPGADMLAAVERGPLAEVRRRIAAGDHADAVELFVDEVALGPGSWARMPDEMRRTMVENAPTYLDERSDPDSCTIDEPALVRFRAPVLITSGDQSPPIFEPILRQLRELLPQAEYVVQRGAGHIPHVTHPEDYVNKLVRFTSGHRHPGRRP